MRSAILEKGEKFYTYMGKIFNAIEDEQLKYNWLITDFECYPSAKYISELFSKEKEYIWISGKSLTDIINEEDFQFIWAVFTGFSQDITLDEVLKYDLPYASEYEGYWADNVCIQHSLSDIEIVAWDSTLTLFICKNDDLVKKFMHNLPLSADLSAQNSRYNAERALKQNL